QVRHHAFEATVVERVDDMHDAVQAGTVHGRESGAGATPAVAPWPRAADGSRPPHTTQAVQRSGQAAARGWPLPRANAVVLCMPRSRAQGANGGRSHPVRVVHWAA